MVSSSGVTNRKSLNWPRIRQSMFICPKDTIHINIAMTVSINECSVRTAPVRPRMQAGSLGLPSCLFMLLLVLSDTASQWVLRSEWNLYSARKLVCATLKGPASQQDNAQGDAGEFFYLEIHLKRLCWWSQGKWMNATQSTWTATDIVHSNECPSSPHLTALYRPSPSSQLPLTMGWLWSAAGRDGLLPD